MESAGRAVAVVLGATATAISLRTAYWLRPDLGTMGVTAGCCPGTASARRAGLGDRIETGSELPGRVARMARAEGVRDVSPDGPWPSVGLAIDALLGTGASGAPRPAVAALLERFLDLEVPVVAIDGPTGLDLLSGVVHGRTRADLSVTFGGFRRGHLLARDEVGSVVVVDIGHPPPGPEWPTVMTDHQAADWLRRLRTRSVTQPARPGRCAALDRRPRVHPLGGHRRTEPRLGLGVIVTGFASAACCSRRSSRGSSASSHPMLDMHFFENPRFSAASGAITLVFLALFGTLFLITQYLQSVLGYSTVKAGAVLLPQAATIMIVRPAVECVGATLRQQDRRHDRPAARHDLAAAVPHARPDTARCTSSSSRC